MSYPNPNNYGRSSTRPSPPGVDSHSGSSYAEQQGRRTTLPPLTIAFPTSFDPPVPPNNYQNPYPTQHRSTPVPYQQSYYSSTQQQAQATHPNYHSYNAPPDPRYHGGQQYSTYNSRTSPSSSLADPRRNPPPPLEVPQPPRDERWQGSQYYSNHTDLQAQHTSGDIRSPHAVYSPASNYPQYQSLTATAYPTGHTSSRATVPSVATANPHYPHYPHHQSMSHANLERSVPSSRTSAQHPYLPPAMSPVGHEQSAEATEPTIKKKRKRADARQLEHLNATYTRTAFPSTEERAQLAKDLDMSARSVQIWFQNKRQAARQGGRNVAAPSGPPEPTPTPPVSGYRGSPVLVSPMVETPGPSFSSRSPPPGGMRSGQTPSPPSGRTHWPRGY